MIERDEQKRYWRHTKLQMLTSLLPFLLAVIVLPLYADAFGLFKELGEARSMVDFFLTPKILKDEHALEIPRLARDFGMTSFKYQLHLMAPERTAKCAFRPGCLRLSIRP